MTTALHHVAVIVRNVEKAIEFYDGVFGFPHIERLTQSVSKNRGAWYRLGELELHLQERSQTCEKTEQHFALVTTEFDKIVDRVLQKGGRTEEAKLITGMRKRCFVYDIDDNRIELLERA